MYSLTSDRVGSGRVGAGYWCWEPCMKEFGVMFVRSLINLTRLAVSLLLDWIGLDWIGLD